LGDRPRFFIGGEQTIWVQQTHPASTFYVPGEMQKRTARQS
jgi:hypothetical protein